MKCDYIGAPKVFLLNQACHIINLAYGAFNDPDNYGCFLVGSSLVKPDWRDVDIRMIMGDDLFKKEFTESDLRSFQHNAKWSLVCSSTSMWLQKFTDLPVDFQIQPQSFANEHFKGQRQAIGFFNKSSEYGS